MNKRGCEVHGYAEREVVGRNWFDLFAPDEERERRRTAFRAQMSGAADIDVHEETLVLTREGDRRTLSWRNTLLRDEAGVVVGMLSSGEDVTERRAAEREIAHLAYHDSLTDLPNRALLEEHLDLALARARRNGHAVALLYVDLDDFKLVNDSLGHAAGDELLRRVADRLGSMGRETDLLARQGGDEFLLLVSDLAGDAQARAESTAAQRHGRAERALHARGRRVPGGREHRDLALPARRRRRRLAAQARRRRHVPGQAPGSLELLRLRGGPQRSARAPLAHQPPAQGAGARRARAALPADPRAAAAAASPAWRRSCAGATPSAGWCFRASSSRWPRRPASSR